jgi:hypothetical protein
MRTMMLVLAGLAMLAAGAADADAASKKKHHRKPAPKAQTISVQSTLASKPGTSADEKMSNRDKGMLDVRSICTNC